MIRDIRANFGLPSQSMAGMPNTASRAFKNPKSLFISHIHNSAIEASDTIYGENATPLQEPVQSRLFGQEDSQNQSETNAEADGAGHIDDRIKERLKNCLSA